MPGSHAVTYLSGNGALYLEVNGRRFDVAQFTASWAVNEIPQGQCLVAVGRNARSDLAGELAAIHSAGESLFQMQRARVVFSPEGEYDPSGAAWPAGERVVFDGYFVGFAHRRMSGKVQVIVNLTHWLIDLANSSCLSKNSHPSNPASLTTAAVMQQLKEAGGAQGAFVSHLTGHRVVQTQVLQDLWGAIKSLFSAVAAIKTSPVGPNDLCGGVGAADATTFVRNDRALNALARMEGPALFLPAALAYKYGVPLVPQGFNTPLVDSAVGNAVCNSLIDSYATTTFWDKLVGEFGPMFGLAVVPLVDRALVVADTPAYGRDHWRAISPDEYDSFDQTAFVERPMRAVAVYGDVASFTGARNGPAPVNHRNVGGCFAAEGVSPGDGLVQYVRAPAWLDTVMSGAVYGGASTGNPRAAATNSPTTPGATRPPPLNTPAYTDQLANVQPLYDRYAQTVYALQALRGRSGTVSGKLRFDIGPGSVVKVAANPDVRTAPGLDKLAGDFYGCVSRVTVNINCESAMAGTTYQLTHLRTAAENRSPRTSVQEHPLFARSIHGSGKHGAPLIEAYEDIK